MLQSNLIIPVVSIIIAMTSIQFGSFLAKDLFNTLGPILTTILRISLAAIMLLISNRIWKQNLNSKTLFKVIPYGSALGFMILSFYLSIDRIPLGIASTLQFLGPLGVAVLDSRKKSNLVWILLAMLGVYLILPVSKINSELDPIGIIFALSGAFCWALYIVFGKKLTQNITSGLASSLGVTFAALIVIPFGFNQSTQGVIDHIIILKGLLLAAVSVAIPYYLELKALKNLSTYSFGILLILEPAIASLIGFIFIGQALTIVQWFAITLVIIASIGSSINLKKEIN